MKNVLGGVSAALLQELGKDKTVAILGALRTGLLDYLIIDDRTLSEVEKANADRSREAARGLPHLFPTVGLCHRTPGSLAPSFVSPPFLRALFRRGGA
jgi:hypothetical protein